MIVRLAGTALIAMTAALAVMFLVVYHIKTRGDWRHSTMGRHLFTFTACVGLVAFTWLVALGARLADVDLHDWFDWVRLVVFATIPAALFWRLRLLLQAQHVPTTDKETHP